jgi:hypothetical protein
MLDDHAAPDLREPVGRRRHSNAYTRFQSVFMSATSVPTIAQMPPAGPIDMRR